MKLLELRRMRGFTEAFFEDGLSCWNLGSPLQPLLLGLMQEQLPKSLLLARRNHDMLGKTKIRLACHNSAKVDYSFSVVLQPEDDNRWFQSHPPKQPFIEAFVHIWFIWYHTVRSKKYPGLFQIKALNNDVTAVSGVNMREEEERLFSEPKGDSQVAEASRRVVQEEEERLILQKTPLHKKTCRYQLVLYLDFGGGQMWLEKYKQ